MKRLLKILFGFVTAILGLTVLYGLFALVLSLIPVNAGAPQATEGIEIYITSNGVHTDFNVPVVSAAIDWRRHFSVQDYAGADASFQRIAFGWGDKGFYLRTPSWSDLTFATAVNALFLPSPTAMHVSYYRRSPLPDENSRKLYLSPEQYQQLIDYILKDFEKTANGEIMLIPDAGYGPYDNFYEAEGSYSLFYTSNNWVNEGLKEIGVKTALWSPFDKGIFYHLDKE